MEKTYRKSQMRKVLGRSVSGLDMHLYGLPYQGAAGLFGEAFGPDSIDLMLAAVERYFPEIHVVSILKCGMVLNRFSEDASFYKLYSGDTDPDIIFTSEFSLDDFSPEEIELDNRMNKELFDSQPTNAELNAIRWGLEKARLR